MAQGAGKAQPGSRTFDDELTDPDAIGTLFVDIQFSGRPVFINDSATGASFLGRVLSVDEGRGAFTIGHTVPEDSLASAGGTFQILAAVEDADFTFEASPLDAAEANEGWREMQLPSVVHRLRRRKEYRGPGFGLAEVFLHRKNAPRVDGLKARLRDISDNGVGISLSGPVDSGVKAGAVFDDCLLLLNGNPVAACAIEIRHLKKDPETSDLIAGGRLHDLDAVSQRRISMLVTTLQCEEIRRKEPHGSH
jgi:c-di-GMP-binding flagellar brake protein YcgR